MRIIRHLTPAGPAYAALQPDGTAREIAGDIYGDFRVTDRVVQPGKLLAPVVPANLLAIGLNYQKHAEEGGRGAPEKPVLFIKATSSLQNPGDPIEIPRHLASQEVDFECELAVVIGRRCKNVPAPTRSITCSATPAPTTCPPATGSASPGAAASGARPRASTPSARSVPCW
jgi:2-keto-4-pentenoate hydratase/2-oxohepta-3-ene-1,7-dioic acid hydratase in catechol pathway